jgi:hypothetical protein
MLEAIAVAPASTVVLLLVADRVLDALARRRGAPTAHQCSRGEDYLGSPGITDLERVMTTRGRA